MRRLACVLCLVAVGCTPNPAAGGLWTAEATVLERGRDRLTDAERLAQGRAVDVGVAERWLVAEGARVTQLVAACSRPGAWQAPSAGIAVRDAVRVKGSVEQRQRVAVLAVADWRARRGAATGDARVCAQAAAALAGEMATAVDPPSWPVVTVSRVADSAAQVAVQAPPVDSSTAVTIFALGVVDAVTAPAPLAAHLAVAYGGSVRPCPLAPLAGQSPLATEELCAPGGQAAAVGQAGADATTRPCPLAPLAGQAQTSTQEVCVPGGQGGIARACPLAPLAGQAPLATEELCALGGAGVVGGRSVEEVVDALVGRVGDVEPDALVGALRG